MCHDRRLACIRELDVQRNFLLLAEGFVPPFGVVCQSERCLSQFAIVVLDDVVFVFHVCVCVLLLFLFFWLMSDRRKTGPLVKSHSIFTCYISAFRSCNTTWQAMHSDIAKGNCTVYTVILL